jgi:hypothetical protein
VNGAFPPSIELARLYEKAPRGSWLIKEYLGSMRKMRLEDARQLMQQHGVPLRAIAAVCPAPTRVALDGDDRYKPNPAGAPAWVIPVCAVDPEMPEIIETDDPLGIVSLGPIVDLLAFHPAAPNRWALRLGLAGALGAIEPQYLDPVSVPAHRDVTAWLRSGCRGIVLLTRDAFKARRILAQVATIEAEDGQHAAELAALLVTPRVTTRTSPRAGA